MTVVRQRFCKHIPEVTQSTMGPPLPGSRSLGARFVAMDKTKKNRVIHELLEMVIYIRFAWKLVQSPGILRSSFVTTEEETFVVQ
jgi:hypothetical protein